MNFQPFIWYSFDELEAPNLLPKGYCILVAMLDVIGISHEEYQPKDLIRFVSVATGKSIYQTFGSDACAVSSEGWANAWGGTIMIDLKKATHWMLIKLPSKHEGEPI